MKYHHSPLYYRIRGKIYHILLHIVSHMRLLIRLILISVFVGAFVGLVGVGFVYCINAVTEFRLHHFWVIGTLPLGGLLIVWLYKITKDEKDQGTNMVLASLRSEKELPMQMAPMIFISTIITHLCGGSAGREGAALQLGGSLGSSVGKLLKMQEEDCQVMILCGMTAAFSAIFRTPIAAPIFAMEVVCVGAMHYAALVPCTVASLTASWIAETLGIPLAKYNLTEIPTLHPLGAGKVLLLALCCAALSIIFCVMLQVSGKQFKKIKNPYLRILACAGILWVLLLIFRTQDYIGVGGQIITLAVAGQVVWYAVPAKMLFTAVTLGGGYKGGEIIPSFFIGATFGCWFGQLIGLSPGFCAAVGMIGVFCGVTNCPLASLIIAIELFGSKGAPYFLLVIAVSYLLSGYYGLYGEQSFLYSKFSNRMVRHKTHKL